MSNEPTYIMAAYTSNAPLNSLGAPAKSFLILLAKSITAKKSPTPNPKLIAAFVLDHLSVDGDVKEKMLTPELTSLMSA
jgi:hypothetical protein